MGKGIKTRVAEKGIKAIDKAAVASERMKEAYIRTKDKAEHMMHREPLSGRSDFLKISGTKSKLPGEMNEIGLLKNVLA